MLIFLSHAKEDSKKVNDLKRDLGQRGFDLWLDLSHMGGGSFGTQINDALSKSDAFIVLLSPDAIRSGWVKLEVEAAIDMATRHKMPSPIFIMIEPCAADSIPPVWGIHQRFDATTNAKYQNALPAIARELRRQQSLSEQVVEERTKQRLDHRSVGRVISRYPILSFAIIGITVLLMRMILVANTDNIIADVASALGINGGISSIGNPYYDFGLFAMLTTDVILVLSDILLLSLLVIDFLAWILAVWASARAGHKLAFGFLTTLSFVGSILFTQITDRALDSSTVLFRFMATAARTQSLLLATSLGIFALLFALLGAQER